MKFVIFKEKNSDHICGKFCYDIFFNYNYLNFKKCIFLSEQVINCDSDVKKTADELDGYASGLPYVEYNAGMPS